MVLAYSIFQRIQNIIHLHVVCDNLQSETQKKITALLEQGRWPHTVSLLPVDSQKLCTWLDQKIHLTRAAYLRLFFENLFPDLDRIIYMDTDMIVVRWFDVPALLQSVDNHSIAAVEEPWLWEIYQQRHPDTPFFRSFNTGFLVMNLQKLRENQMLQKIIVWLQEHMESVLYADQDGFDAVLSDDCTTLDPRLNAIKWNIEDPYVIHYAGSNRKPWLKRWSLLSSRSMISTLPYVFFRQKTPLRKPIHEVISLLFCQCIIAFLRIGVIHRVKGAKKRIKKLRSLIG